MLTCQPSISWGVEHTRWLTEQEQAAWRSYIAMHTQLQRRLSRQLQQTTGLSESDYAVLVHLSEAEHGRMRAGDLGRSIGWEKSRLSHHLTRMAQRGLVVREVCATDRRGAFIGITKEGRAAIERASPQHVEQVRRWFVDLLTPAQLKSLRKISDTVLGALASDQAEVDADAACDER